MKGSFIYFPMTKYLIKYFYNETHCWNRKQYLYETQMGVYENKRPCSEGSILLIPFSFVLDLLAMVPRRIYYCTKDPKYIYEKIHEEFHEEFHEEYHDEREVIIKV